MERTKLLKLKAKATQQHQIYKKEAECEYPEIREMSGYAFFVFDRFINLIDEILTEDPDPIITRIAWEVWEGRWGNGRHRVSRLTRAGFDYDLIQAEVNRLNEKYNLGRRSWKGL